MTKLLAPEDAVNATSRTLMENLSRHFADNGFSARTFPANGGSDDRIMFSFKGSVGMRCMGKAIRKFLPEGPKDTLFGGGIGYLDTKCPEGALRIFFGISPGKGQGFIVFKFLNR